MGETVILFLWVVAVLAKNGVGLYLALCLTFGRGFAPSNSLSNLFKSLIDPT